MIENETTAGNAEDLSKEVTNNTNESSNESVENKPEPLGPESNFAVETSSNAFTGEQSEKKEKKAFQNPYSLENFDWDAIGKKHENYSKAEREKYEKLYEETLNAITEHEVIEGTIVSKSSREIVVNIGFKSDGVIPLSEVRYNPNIKVGDKLEVYVETQEDANGQLLLSHKKARTLKAWERINSALENGEIINGYVKCRTKGGLIVDVFGIEAFLPGSQIDVKPIRDYDIYVDKTMEFKVVKINHEFKNVVVSHKALIEAELEQQKVEIMSKLEKGQILEGTVKNITSYGVFIDLGGVDGLIHITDLSWGRISHPQEIVELDQKINVVILDFDDEKKRIALGLKQLTPHPWDNLDPNLAVGDKVKGKVVVIADYGAFIEIAPGVEGLIHVSEMTWSQHLRSAQEFLAVDQEVEAVILTLDRENRKMSLGMKQLKPDPWDNIIEKYAINSKHKAIVRNFTNFGVFVELEEGVDGLIHISDLSWSKKIKHPAEFTNIGDEIEVIVLDIDKENRRLSLGHKQIEENPWEVFESVFTPDSIHQGTIVNINDKGAIISLPYGVEGFAPIKHIIKADNTTARVDETLDFKVLEFSKDSKKIVVSHSRIYLDAQAAEKAKEEESMKSEEKEAKKAVKKVKEKIERSTLGDIEALAELKSGLEAQEKEKREQVKKSLDEKEERKSKVQEDSIKPDVSDESNTGQSEKEQEKETKPEKSEE
ncbi:MAG: 30S ribosomal protein S1 [Bacteroidota bacterium]|nr:30S ribosomal protein S1 [Bacteroidota bacterium]